LIVANAFAGEAGTSARRVLVRRLPYANTHYR